MNAAASLRTLPFLVSLLLAGCRDPYELLVERSDDDVDRSCNTICFDAVTSAETQAEDSFYEYDLIGCEDVVEQGRDLVACHFMVPE